MLRPPGSTGRQPWRAPSRWPLPRLRRTPRSPSGHGHVASGARLPAPPTLTHGGASQHWPRDDRCSACDGALTPDSQTRSPALIAGVDWSSNRALAIASAAAGTAAQAKQSTNTIRARRGFSGAGEPTLCASDRPDHAAGLTTQPVSAPGRRVIHRARTNRRATRFGGRRPRPVLRWEPRTRSADIDPCADMLKTRRGVLEPRKAVAVTSSRRRDRWGQTRPAEGGVAGDESVVALPSDDTGESEVGERP